MINAKIRVLPRWSGSSAASAVLFLLCVSAPSLAADSRDRDEWRSQLNLVDARTAVDFPPTAGISGAPNHDALVNVIVGNDDVADMAVASSSSGTAWLAQVGYKTIKLDAASASVAIRDSRGYDATKTVGLSDVDMYLAAVPLLTALGVRPDETDWRVVQALARDQDENGLISPPRTLAKKLLVQRTIGWLRVGGDRLVVSFAPDGTIRKVSGVWHAVDLGLSTLATPRPVSQIGELALDKLELERTKRTMHVQPRPLRVATFLQPHEVRPGLFRLEIAGQLDVPLAGPNGDLRTTRYTFDL